MRIRLDGDENIRRVVRRLRAVAEDMSPAMKEVAGYLKRETQNRFFTKKAPDGSTWARLSRVTQRRRLKRRKRRNDKLIFSGRLVRSIRSEYDGRSATVGTDVPYASTHQFGAERGEFGSFSIIVRTIQGRRRQIRRGKIIKAEEASVGVSATRRTRGRPIPWGDIPARPFFGLSADDRNEISDIIRRHLERLTR